MSPPSVSSETGTTACPDAADISCGMDKDGLAGRGVAVGVGVGVNTATSGAAGNCTEPLVVRPFHGRPWGSKKDAGGEPENRTGEVSLVELVLLHVIAKVISTTIPLGIDRNGATISEMTMSISPSVSPTSWENAIVKPNGTVKRTASGSPLPSSSAGSRLIQGWL